MPERFGLLTLIVLGEAIVVGGVAAGATRAWPALLVATLGFVVAGCVWWLDFAHVDEERSALAVGARSAGGAGGGPARHGDRPALLAAHVARKARAAVIVALLLGAVALLAVALVVGEGTGRRGYAGASRPFSATRSTPSVR